MMVLKNFVENIIQLVKIVLELKKFVGLMLSKTKRYNFKFTISLVEIALVSLPITPSFSV
jgi:hypothetical protein